MSDFKITNISVPQIPLNLFKIEFYVATTATEDCVKQDLWANFDEFGSHFEALVFHELDYKVYENGQWVERPPVLLKSGGEK